MATFAVLVAVVFSFALDPTVRSTDIAGAMLWVTVLFAGTLGLGRSFALEREADALTGVLVSPVPRGAVFLGKFLANLLVVLAVEAVIFPVYALFFGLQLGRGAGRAGAGGASGDGGVHGAGDAVRRHHGAHAAWRDAAPHPAAAAADPRGDLRRQRHAAPARRAARWRRWAATCGCCWRWTWSFSSSAPPSSAPRWRSRSTQPGRMNSRQRRHEVRLRGLPPFVGVAESRCHSEGAPDGTPPAPAPGA